MERREAMYFQQSDLFDGTSEDFLKEIMGLAIKESHRKGYVLFRRGDRARYFYILVKGQVKIRIGENGYIVYTVDRSGEAFGWSSLVGRDVYSASAECRISTNVLKIDFEKLQEILEKDPASGLIFFKSLAGTLGDRLLQTYKMISVASQPEISSSFGTGQVLESEATTA
jgi:CRP/FNR family cyclic AMP-dependent transcriptional regulator